MNRCFRAGKFCMPLSKKTYVMGILNVTPDSFSDGGLWDKPEEALERALLMEREGADLLDIGAQSTRPGYTAVSQEEELKRLLPVLECLKDQISIPISVDTFYPTVAKEALQYGVNIINDVTGFQEDDMMRVAAESDCGCIIMHDKGGAVLKPYFIERLRIAERFGIQSDRICFDPGIGFSKTYEENLFLLKNLSECCVPGCAMLVGASRKRVIGQPCGNPPFQERMPGTIAAHTIAICGGADIIRVHDVKESVQAVKVTDAILRS